MDNNTLTSLQLERSFLSGLIKHQMGLLSEVDPYFSDKDFSNTLHSTIYTVARRILFDGSKLEKIILAEKINQLGIRFEDNVTSYHYINNLGFSQINLQGAIDTARELIKLRVLRELNENARAVQKFIIDNREKTIREIVTGVDKINNDKINLYTSEDDPIDLFSKIEGHLRHIAENPQTESGLITPFNIYNKYFGGLLSGDGTYTITGRTSEGKSLFLLNFAKGIALLNNVKVLILDTEMSLDLSILRAASAEIGLNLWMLRTGNWIRNEELTKKVTSKFPEFIKYNNLVYHKYVPNRDIHDLCSIIRKFYFKYVGRGNKMLVVLDYLKIPDIGGNERVEWQKFGDYMNYLNELGNTLGIHTLAGAQQNRTGQQGGKRLDDSTTIGGSDRIGQYSRYAAVFRRKTIDEISRDGISFGTHMLKPVKWSRDQGKDDYDSNSLIRVVNSANNQVTYEPNFISFESKNYNLIEKGSYQDIINSHHFNHNIQGPHHHNQNGQIQP